MVCMQPVHQVGLEVAVAGLRTLREGPVQPVKEMLEVRRAVIAPPTPEVVEVLVVLVQLEAWVQPHRLEAQEV